MQGRNKCASLTPIMLYGRQDFLKIPAKPGRLRLRTHDGRFVHGVVPRPAAVMGMLRALGSLADRHSPVYREYFHRATWSLGSCRPTCCRASLPR